MLGAHICWDLWGVLEVLHVTRGLYHSTSNQQIDFLFTYYTQRRPPPPVLYKYVFLCVCARARLLFSVTVVVAPPPFICHPRFIEKMLLA